VQHLDRCFAVAVQAVLAPRRGRWRR
jgi:hypothetical protein